MEARGVCGCLGICGRFRLHHLPSWGLDPGERLQYCGLVGKWQHSGNGPRKASSYESPRPILDQRHMQTSSPGLAWKEGQPLHPSRFLGKLPGHLSPRRPLVESPSSVSAELGPASTVCEATRLLRVRTQSSRLWSSCLWRTGRPLPAPCLGWVRNQRPTHSPVSRIWKGCEGDV